MKLVSWNVNGIRAAVRKGFMDVIADWDVDVICLQEVRATEEQSPLDLPGWNIHWYEAEKKGYSGVAVLTRLEAPRVTRGLGIEKHDHEGRVLSLELPDFHLVNVYTPNSQHELKRLDYRLEWDQAFLAHVCRLERDKPVVFCGDLNVAHREIDLANPRTNHHNPGFTDEERASFDAILAAGFIDTFREFCDEGGHYSWWSNRANSRARNVGWRIDYFCITGALRPRLRAAGIWPEVPGSDHCPVFVEIG